MSQRPRVRVELAHGIDAEDWSARHAAGAVPDRLPFGLQALGDRVELSFRPAHPSACVKRCARPIDHRVGGLQWTRALVSAPPYADLLLCWDEWTGIPAALRRELHGARRAPGPPVLSGIMNLTDWDDLPTPTRALVRHGAQRLDGVFTHTTVQRDLLVAQWGLDPGRLWVVPFGVDPEFFRPVGDPVPGLVVSVGDDEHRDHALLVAALEQVRRRRADTRLLLATTRTGLDVPEGLGAVINAKLGPYRPQFYGAGQVVAVAAKSSIHGSGLTVVLEAMAGARPWVATASPGFDDHFHDGDGGILVPPGDTEAFARAVDSLLADPVAATELGERGRALVLGRLNSTVMGAALADVVDSVLERRSTSRAPRVAGASPGAPPSSARAVPRVPDVLALLRCPVTGAELTFRRAEPGPLTDGLFGVLTGGAYDYPVIDGVPVLRHGRLDVQAHVTGAPEVIGPLVSSLVELVRAGDGVEALVLLLALPTELRLAGRRVPGQQRVGAVRAANAGARRRRVRRTLATGDRGELNDWLELLYGRATGVDPELAHYFRLRDALPRQLAAHAALPVLRRGDGPVLDIACGLGHLDRDLVLAGHDTVLGLDRTFYQVWLARHFVAPGAFFICAAADEGLPLADAAVGSVMCSDALHFIPEPERLVAEARRCCPTGPLLFTRVGNLELEPHEGRERTPAGWSEVFGDLPVRVLGERELMSAYLRRAPVSLSDRPPSRQAALSGEKWLTLVAGAEPVLDADLAAPTERPHARGALRFNPVYRQVPQADGGMTLVFEFPTTWFALENHRMAEYHAAATTVPGEVVADVVAQRRTPPVRELVENFVVIGGGPAG